MPRMHIAAALLLAAATPAFAQNEPATAPATTRASSAPRARKGITLEQAQKRTAARFARADTNNDGVVTREELRQFKEEVKAEHKARSVERAKRRGDEPAAELKP